MGSCYMIVPTIDLYRWIGRKQGSESPALAKIRESAVVQIWQPVEVEWLPETKGRRQCDFPIFHPIVRGISRRAAKCLFPVLNGAAELLPLSGLSENYMGLHCTHWIDAAIIDQGDDIHGSIYSTLFTPKVRAADVVGASVFGLKGFVTKLFVDERFREIVDSCNLTGLDFYDVDLV